MLPSIDSPIKITYILLARMKSIMRIIYWKRKSELHAIFYFSLLKTWKKKWFILNGFLMRNAIEFMEFMFILLYLFGIVIKLKMVRRNPIYDVSLIIWTLNNNLYVVYSIKSERQQRELIRIKTIRKNNEYVRE